MGHFNVKAILRSDKKRKDGSCPVYIKITISNRSTKIPVGVYGTAEEWDPLVGLFIEPGSSVRNSILRKKVVGVEEFLWKQVAASNEISLAVVRFHFGKAGRRDFYSLLEDCYKHQFRLLAPSTKKHYLLVKQRLMEFDGVIGLNKINEDFLLRFEVFLRGKGIGDGGVGTHHKVLRVVLNYGIRKKIITENPYFYFKVKRGQSRYANLSEEQIISIQSLRLTDDDDKPNKGLELTRDMFLFSCYTALRFGDVSSLTKSNVVKSSYLEIKQSKTGSIVRIPLLERSAAIINKYTSQERDSLFPSISNQVANRHLKDIARMCSIDINLHFHLSRHSFGTIMANNGMNAYALSKLMGHRSIKTTMLYVNNTLDKDREQMAQVSIFS